jgi:hypothetical protein
MHYGQVLADFNKVAQVSCRARLVIVVADDPCLAYLQRSGPGSAAPQGRSHHRDQQVLA